MTDKIMLAKDWAQARQTNITAGKKPLTGKAKVQKMAAIFKQGGSVKLGEAMVGPISIRINYEGIARQALVEDLVPQGEIRQYPVLSDLPVAYALNSNDGQVRISRVEGKAIVPEYGRIAAEWEIARSDLELLAVNIVDYADNMTVQQIMKEEDNLLYNGLELLLNDWTELNGGDTSNVLQATTTALTLDDIIDAQAHIVAQQLDAKNLIMNPARALDMYKWDAVTTGLAFKESYFAGNQYLTFGDWNVLKSVTMPMDTIYVTAAADYLGIWSTRYGLEQVDNPNALDKFLIRKIFNELCACVVVNPLAVSKIKF